MKQFDERDMVFSRIGLTQGTKEYKNYYKMHPELKEEDDHLRFGMENNMAKQMNKTPEQMQKMMKLMRILSKMPFIPLKGITPDGMPPYQTADKKLDAVRNSICGLLIKNANNLSKQAERTPVNSNQLSIDPATATTHIKELAKYYGADLVGIVKLQKEHLYSHKGAMMGMGKSGKEIKLNHKYAIVVASALDKDLINRAPHSEQVLGTMKGYANSCDVCSNLVIHLKKMGYDSIGDNFINYLSPTTPLAIEAGIGQMGRSNMCVSKEYGTRMKMGAVLTNLELIADSPIDFGLTEFCKICRLCAKNCPSKAISQEDNPTIENGELYWKHKSTKCMEMWSKVGTDCGICMSSCPFSQGVDKVLVEQMKGNPEIMEKILQEHTEKYGKRNYIEQELPLVKIQ